MHTRGFLLQVYQQCIFCVRGEASWSCKQDDKLVILYTATVTRARSGPRSLRLVGMLPPFSDSVRPRSARPAGAGCGLAQDEVGLRVSRALLGVGALELTTKGGASAQSEGGGQARCSSPRGLRGGSATVADGRFARELAHDWRADTDARRSATHGCTPFAAPVFSAAAAAALAAAERRPLPVLSAPGSPAPHQGSPPCACLVVRARGERRPRR